LKLKHFTAGERKFKSVESDIRNADKDLFKCHKNVNISHNIAEERDDLEMEWKINEMFLRLVNEKCNKMNTK